MQTSIFTILALSFIGITTAVPSYAVAKAHADEDIIYLLDQNTLIGGTADPEITSQCFSYYMPLLIQVSVNFSLQYEQCVTTASQTTAKLFATAAQNRAAFVNETTSICNAFTSCKCESSSLDFLNCYATAASADVNEIYNLWENASNTALSLKGGLQQVNDTENVCKNRAQKTYSSQTSKTYKELYACFTNGLPAGTLGTSAAI